MLARIAWARLLNHWPAMTAGGVYFFGRVATWAQRLHRLANLPSLPPHLAQRRAMI